MEYLHSSVVRSLNAERNRRGRQINVAVATTVVCDGGTKQSGWSQEQCMTILCDDCECVEYAAMCSPTLLHCRRSHPSLCTSFTSTLERNFILRGFAWSDHLVATLLLDWQVELELSWKLLFRVQPCALLVTNSRTVMQFAKFTRTEHHHHTFITLYPTQPNLSEK